MRRPTTTPDTCLPRQLPGGLQADLYAGAVDPADRRARTRTPVELRLAHVARFDHDFPGRRRLGRRSPTRDAPRSPCAGTPMTSSTSTPRCCDPDDPYKPRSTSRPPPHLRGLHGARGPRAASTAVRSAGSSGTAYSSRYREVISHGMHRPRQSTRSARRSWCSGATTAARSRTSGPPSPGSPTSTGAQPDLRHRRGTVWSAQHLGTTVRPTRRGARMPHQAAPS